MGCNEHTVAFRFGKDNEGDRLYFIKKHAQFSYYGTNAVRNGLINVCIHYRPVTCAVRLKHTVLLTSVCLSAFSFRLWLCFALVSPRISKHYIINIISRISGSLSDAITVASTVDLFIFSVKAQSTHFEVS